jgi:hypothetical protein
MRHKGLVIGLVVGFVAIGGIAGAAGSGSGSSGSSPAPAVSSAAPATHTTRTIATFTGSGVENTPKFTVGDTWKLVYSFNCSSFGQAGNFMVDEDDSLMSNLHVNDMALRKHGTTWSYGDAGTHFLNVDSECSWKIKVVG